MDKPPVVRNLDEEGVLTPAEATLQRAVAEKGLKGVARMRKQVDGMRHDGMTLPDNPMVFPREYTDHLRDDEDY